MAPKFNWALSGGSFSRLTFQVRRRTCLGDNYVLANNLAYFFFLLINIENIFLANSVTFLVTSSTHSHLWKTNMEQNVGALKK